MALKGKIKLISMTALAIFTLGGTVFGTFAWFVASTSNDPYKLTGKSAGAYFAYGNGNDPDNANPRPFGISTPRHLYNLAWLQYMGQFDDRQYYFELADSIPDEGLDMTGYILPPIGTKDNPFVGNFNGNGKIIKNLTVSNDKTTLFAASNKHPDESMVTYTAPEIVGVFGVVGNLDSSYTGTYSSEVNTVTDLTIANATIATTTSQTLAGIAAGYVDATLSNVALSNSSIDVNDNASCIKKNDKPTFTKNISDYTAVGYCTDDYKTDICNTSTNNTYGLDVHTKEFSVDDSGDGGVGKGGSIKMTDIYHRIDSCESYANRTSTLPTRQTVYYNEDGTVRNTVDDATANDFTVYHSNGYETGNYIVVTDNQDRYNSLAGGVYKQEKQYHYYDHEGSLFYTEIDGIKHYLCAYNVVITNYINVSDTTVKANALVWNVFGGNSGTISTTYNNTIYYLDVYNQNQLRLSSGSGTTFTKQVVGGYTTYTFNNRYIGYKDGGWQMLPIPSGSPPASQEGRLNINDFRNDSYQLSYRANSTTYYVSSSANASGSTILGKTTPHIGWTFTMPNTGETGTSRIGSSNTVNGDINRYIYSDEGSSFNYNQNSTTWNVIHNNDDTYSFYIHWTTGGGCGRTHYRYIQFNGTTISLSNDSTSLSNPSNSQKFTVGKTSDAISLYNEPWTSWDDFDNYEGIAFEEVSEAQGNVVHGPDEHLTDVSSGMYYTEENTTFLPINVATDGAQQAASFDETKYYPSASNTGYIISGSGYNTNYSSSSAATKIRISRYDLSSITTSYGSGDFKTSNGTPNIYTLDSSYNYVKANSTIYENFDETLAKLKIELNKDSDYVYGMHFLEEQINKNACITARHVVLNSSSTPYSNYKMPVNSINFHLIEKGYINFFAGMFYGNNTIDGKQNDAFMSLHQIKRNPTTQEIEEIKEIKEVLSDGKDEHSYIYRFTDGKYSRAFQYNSNGAQVTLDLQPYSESLNESSLPTSYLDPSDGNKSKACSYTKVFDTQRITNHWYAIEAGQTAGAIVNSNMTYNGSVRIDNQNVPTKSSIFYFEIPMNNGEFCLGSVSGGTGGYLFYLDIGANAKKLNRTFVAEHYEFITELCTYPNGVAFIDLNNYSGSVTDGDGAFMTLLADISDYSKVTINRKNNGVNVTEGYSSTYLVGEYKNNGITLRSGTDPPDGTNIDIVAKEEKLEIRRYQYFDYDAAKHETTKTVITSTVIYDKIDGVFTERQDSATLDIVQYVNETIVYDKNSDDPNLIKVDNAHFYNNSGARIVISTLGAPTAGTNTEIIIVVYDTVSTQSGKITPTVELQANRNGNNTYFTITGYVVNYDAENDTMTFTIQVSDSLPPGYSVSGSNSYSTDHYEVTITISGIVPIVDP